MKNAWTFLTVVADSHVPGNNLCYNILWRNNNKLKPSQEQVHVPRTYVFTRDICRLFFLQRKRRFSHLFQFHLGTSWNYPHYTWLFRTLLSLVISRSYELNWKEFATLNRLKHAILRNQKTSLIFLWREGKKNNDYIRFTFYRWL